MRLRWASSLIVVSLLVAGCTGAPVAEPPRTVPQSTGGSTVRPVDEPLVSYRRSGGMAGADDRLVVYADGGYRLSGRRVPTRSGILAATDLAELRRVAAEAHIARLAGPSGASAGGLPATSTASAGTSSRAETDNNGATAPGDAFRYEVTYEGHVTGAVDGAVPPSLEPLLSVLAELLSKYQGRRAR